MYKLLVPSYKKKRKEKYVIRLFSLLECSGRKFPASTLRCYLTLSKYCWCEKNKIFFCITLLDLERYYLPTPPLGQDMTQGQFLSGV